MARTNPRTYPSPAAKTPRPDGELRLGQVITTYGPGALVDLLHEAILIPGLDHWRYGKGAAHFEIQADDLARNLRARDFNLNPSMPFRAPPLATDDQPSPSIGIGPIEFPSWFVCTQPQCERLIHKRDANEKSGIYYHRCAHSPTPRKLVPVRFAVACTNGHLDDFPWNWFAHNGPGCAAPELRLIDRGSGDLSDVVLRCEACDAKERPLGDARAPNALPKCSGRRPWLSWVGDPNTAEPCHGNENLRLLVRTASGGYFSAVESALTIPKHTTLPPDIEAFLHRHDSRDLGKLTSFDAVTHGREYIPVLQDLAVARLSNAELWDYIRRFRKAQIVEQSSGSAPPVRESEYATLCAAPVEPGDDNYVSPRGDEKFTAHRPQPGTVALPAGIDTLVLVSRLCEVRVLIGFTRIEPPVQNIYGEFDRAKLSALAYGADWLPATEIRGEGFFVRLDPHTLAKWEARPAVQARAKELEAGWKLRFPKHRQQGHDFPGIRFYLLHTLSHLLITQVSLECGYAASAIRERLYCTPPGTTGPTMAGLLLSTGSSGSEGTLGGLVQQGRRLKPHLEDALRRAKLCSHDPVCARATPDNIRPGRTLLGAACHGCLFIAECSCERANQYLDRALLVPILGNDPNLAYFASPSG